jgi:Ca2+-binding RTX toxin-like protein
MATVKKAQPVILNVMGTDGDDILRSTGAVEMINGGSGMDTLVFDEGTRGVSVNLSTGKIRDSFGKSEVISSIEVVVGTSFNDTMTGSAGADIFDGGAGNDRISAGGGNDEIYGGAGNDSMSGGDGNDKLVGGSGNDTLNGGNGFDLADYSGEGGGSGVTVNLAKGTATDSYGDTDKLSSIEHVRGTDFADAITGNSANNFFQGGGGDDVLDGAGGDDALWGDFGADKLVGGTGNDSLAGGHGNDTLDGGKGVDTADYAKDGGWRGVSVDLSTGFAEDSWASLDTLVSIENVTGTGFADWIRGNASANVIAGGAGDDTMIGFGGNDTFVFGADHGNDRINDFNAGDVLDFSALGFKSVEDVIAASEGHDLGVLIHTSATSSIVLVDVNVNSMASLNYLFV